MGDFPESRARDLKAGDFVIDLQALHKAKEGELLNAFAAVYEIFCCSELTADDVPLAMPAALIIVDRLKGMRNKGMGSKVNQTNRYRGNWGNTEDYTIVA